MSVLPSTLCGATAAAGPRRAHRAPCTPCPTRRPCPGRRRRGAAGCPPSHGPATYANLDHAASTPALVDGQAGGRPHARDLRLGAPRRGLRLAADERVVRAGPRRGRRVRRCARPTTRSSSPARRPTRGALLSQALPSRTTVFVFGSEHHSTLLPWGRLRTVRLPVPQGVDDARALLEEALADNPSRHRLVVIAAASNVTGEVWPVERFAAVAHAHGARHRRRRRTALGPPHASTSPAGTPTTSPSRATRPTRPSAPACSRGGPTGSTPAPPTCSAAARPGP